MQPTIAIVANRYSDFRRPVIEQMAVQFNESGIGVLCVIGRELQAIGINTQNSMHAYNSVYRECAAYPVQGYIVLSSTLSFDGTLACVQQLVGQLCHKPVISFGIDIPGVLSLRPNNRAGMRDLMQHMTSDPLRRNFVFIRGGKTMPDSVEREAQFRATLETKGIPIQDDLILDGRFFSADAYAAMQNLLQTRTDIHAVVAASDVMAVSAIQALREHGLRVPEDVIVSGFDDREIASDCIPPLTTVSYAFTERASVAVDALMALMDGNDAASIVHACNSTDSRLVTRHSSAHSNDQRRIIGGGYVVSQAGPQSYFVQSDVATKLLARLDQLTPNNTVQATIRDHLRDSMTGIDADFLESLKHYLQDVSRSRGEIAWCEHLVEDCVAVLTDAGLWEEQKQLMGTLIHGRKLLDDARRSHAQKLAFDTERVRRLQDDLHIELASCVELSNLSASLGEFARAMSLKRFFLILDQPETKGPHVGDKYLVLSFRHNSTTWYETQFPSTSVLPDDLVGELGHGLLVQVPLCSEAKILGYLLVDTSGVPTLSVENLANSIGNAVSSCIRLQVLEHQALDLRQKNASLVYLANHDELTGLKNRAALSDQLAASIARSQRKMCNLEVMFIDLDGFKAVNDSCGHAAGDNVLRQVAQRLTRLCRNTDHLARFGGDEFAILVESPLNNTSAHALALLVLAELEAPFLVANLDIVLTASIGIARFGDGEGEGDSVENLLKQSDTSMYHAKSSGKNRVSSFADSMSAEIHKRMLLESAIKRGIDEGEFHVQYQPRVNIVKGAILGFEALMRWRPSHSGIQVEDTSPDIFIALAEASGSIVKLDKLALEQACAQLKTWQEQYNIQTRVSVNMSVMRLQQPGLVGEVRETIERHGIDPSMIELEVTESAAMEDISINIKTLKELRLLGVNLSIDDFGTGYSSLAYLKKLPVTCLKIDQSFLKGVMDNDGDNSDAEIVKTIIALGKSMGYTLVAEGVEQQAQCDFLIQNGCEQAQGFLFAPSLSSSDATLMLSQSIYGVANEAT